MSVTTIAILIFVVLIVIVLRSANKTGQKAAADIRVIVQLKQAGSKLDKPHEIDFFLYFLNETAATVAAQELQGKGFSTSVQPSAHNGSEWLLQAKRSMLPTAEALVQIRKELEALAFAGQGKYDGWGAGVVR